MKVLLFARTGGSLFTFPERTARTQDYEAAFDEQRLVKLARSKGRNDGPAAGNPATMGAQQL